MYFIATTKKKTIQRKNDKSEETKQNTTSVQV